jgi:hypothetical protein
VLFAPGCSSLGESWFGGRAALAAGMAGCAAACTEFSSGMAAAAARADPVWERKARRLEFDTVELAFGAEAVDSGDLRLRTGLSAMVVLLILKLRCARSCVPYDSQISIQAVIAEWRY